MHDTDLELDRRVVGIFLSVALAVIAAVIALRILTGTFDQNAIPTVVLSVVLSSALVLLYLDKCGPVPAALVLILGELIVVPHRVLSTGMANAGALHWLLPTFALAGFILRGRSGWIIFAAAVTEIFLIHYSGARMQGASGSAWAISAFVVACAQSLPFIGFRVFRRAYQKEFLRAAELNRDLAARNKMLLLAQESALQASKAKTEFLATMSHEIRTPLHAVMGLVELAARESTEPRVQDYLKRAVRSSSFLTAEVNDILDLARLDTAAVELVHASFDVSEAVAGVVNLFQADAARKNLRLSAAVEPSRFVTGDARRVSQILTNIVSNAVKFTESGFVKITMHTQETEGIVELEVVVEDSGPGIPPDHLSSIFDAFSQVDASTSRRAGGSGLGLAISQRLAHLMNGQITVDSRIGHGSIFTIRLQFAEASEPPRAAELLIPAGIHVMVVDDDEVNRFVFERMCQALGVPVFLAAGGEEALEMLEARPCDVVFMDCHMPGMSGADTAARMRRSGFSGRILGLTADATAELKTQCAAAGLERVLTKPLSLADLRAALSEVKPVPAVI